MVLSTVPLYSRCICKGTTLIQTLLLFFQAANELLFRKDTLQAEYIILTILHVLLNHFLAL